VLGGLDGGRLVGRNEYSSSIITWRAAPVLLISSHLGRLLNLNIAVITALVGLPPADSLHVSAAATAAAAGAGRRR